MVVTLSNATMPFFFVTGDESMYNDLKKENVSSVIGSGEFEEAIRESTQIWGDLMKKYNVFYLHKYYFNEKLDRKVVEQWGKMIGKERVLQMKTPKACVDVMLGAIALTSQKRTLEEYIKDMKTRG